MTPFAPLLPSARNTADRHPAVCAPRSRERQRCASPRTRLATHSFVARLRSTPTCAGLSSGVGFVFEFSAACLFAWVAKHL